MIDMLFGIIKARKTHPREGSYTTALFEAGPDEILKKVGEEAVEVVIAGASQSDERLVSEMADLTYHCLVLLAQRGLSPEDIAQELERRHKP
jgi:phosphoribosyl-ATP pyrophosphohydrolase